MQPSDDVVNVDWVDV